MRLRDRLLHRTSVHRLLRGLGTAAAYVVAARFGFALAFATEQVTAVWPPTGIAVVALVVLGTEVWPALFAGALLANALANESLATAAGIAVGNTLAPLAAAALLRRWRFDRRLEAVRDVVLLVLAALLSMTVSASNGVANLLVAGLIRADAAPSVWWVWWTGDALGVIVFAPLLLAWAAPRAPHERRARPAELAAVSALLLAILYLAFWGRLLPPGSRLEYAVFPLVIWLALRFGKRAVAGAVVAVCAAAIWGVVHDRGPFADGPMDQRLILLDVFIAVTTVTAMALAAITAQRAKAEAALQSAHDELEGRVKGRTAELAAANADLARSNVELERFAYAASHDLRSPLRAVTSLAHWIAHDPDNRLTAESRRHLALLQARAGRMDRLLRDLLEFSRLEHLDTAPEAVDLPGLLAEVADGAHRPEGFVIEADTAVASLHTCRLPLQRVLMNLVDNAIKHHDRTEGRVTIQARDEGAVVRFAVIDDGPGIPPQHRQRVFQMFQTLKPRDAVEGSGMGLAMVKKIVEWAGGEVSVADAPGRGATLQFTWPRALPARARPPRDSQPESRKSA